MCTYFSNYYHLTTTLTDVSAAYLSDVSVLMSDVMAASLNNLVRKEELKLYVVSV